ncbi:MAG: 2-oxo acid dehydrogenase subunit E2 [Gammaproteobacteria bacterium]|nr:2-oxo acid dehydrogenase subunit E2 [Gammaproteobacteria bacterium]
MNEFRMPSLGADMEAGTLVEWKVAVGDRVQRGEVVALVETDKGIIDVEIFTEGVIESLCVEPGETLPVGTVLAQLSGAGAEAEAEAEGTPPPEPARPAKRDGAAPAVVHQHPDADTPTATDALGADTHATVGARRRATELGIDVMQLTGTGLDGRVTLADVEVLAGFANGDTVVQLPAEPATDTRDTPAAAMRRAIAAAMTRANRDIPHYALFRDVDLSRALDWLTAHNEGLPPDQRLLPAALLAKACALGLRRVPALNAYWIEGDLQPVESVHLGWAISLRGGGLVAPALHDADRLPLPELMHRLADLVGRARRGGLRSSELSEATCTVTSLGDRGADGVVGVIYPPQVALIGIGRIAPRPRVVGDAVVPRPQATVSLMGDHRASDGQTGGRLLDIIDDLLQEPERL